MILIDKKKKKALLKKFKEWDKENTEYVNLDRTHKEADQALLDLIGDKDITKAFNDLDKWYA